MIGEPVVCKQELLLGLRARVCKRSRDCASCLSVRAVAMTRSTVPRTAQHVLRGPLRARWCWAKGSDALTRCSAAVCGRQSFSPRPSTRSSPTSFSPTWR
eukprot:1127248-Rhodomonas_salina.2